MNKIKSIILDQTNWLELNIENEEGIIIHCESFGDSDEYQVLLRQRLVEFEVEITQELEYKLQEQVAKRHIPTEEELEAKRLANEEYRVQSIKLTARNLILQKYPLEKQSSANLGLYGEEYLTEMKAYITNIIRISNEAEANGTTLEEVNWEVTNGNSN